MTTPDDTDFDLHLPAGTKDAFLKRIAEVPEEKRTLWRFHVVQANESLETIAASFHGRASEIESANELTAGDPVAAGDGLVVPVTATLALPHPLRYITRAGDTLVTIADRFNVSVEELRRWNHLTSSRVGAQRSLYVSTPVHLAPVTHVRSKRSRAGSASRTVAATPRAATIACTPHGARALRIPPRAGSHAPQRRRARMLHQGGALTMAAAWGWRIGYLTKKKKLAIGGARMHSVARIRARCKCSPSCIAKEIRNAS